MFQVERPLSSDDDCAQALIANASPVPDEAGAALMAVRLRILIDKIARAAGLIRDLGGAVQAKLQTETVSNLSKLLHLVETAGRQIPAAGFGNDRDESSTVLASLSGQLDDIVRGLECLVLLARHRSPDAAGAARSRAGAH